MKIWFFVVAFLKIASIAQAEGQVPACKADIDGNGIVDIADFLIFTQHFGKTNIAPCEPDTVKMVVRDTVTVFDPSIHPQVKYGYELTRYYFASEGRLQFSVALSNTVVEEQYRDQYTYYAHDDELLIVFPRNTWNKFKIHLVGLSNGEERFRINEIEGKYDFDLQILPTSYQQYDADLLNVSHIVTFSIYVNDERVNGLSIPLLQYDIMLILPSGKIIDVVENDNIWFGN